jgi:glucose/arabinose dehydrogenase
MFERAGEPREARRIRRRRLVAVAAAVVGLVAGGLWLVLRPDGDSERSVSDGADEPATGDVDDANTTTTAAGVAAGPPDQGVLDGLELRLEPVAEIEHPTAVVEHPGTGDLLVSSLAGSIVRTTAEGGSPAIVADFGDQISTSGESGLLDIAFNAAGDLLYVSLVERDGDLALVEIPYSAGALATDLARTLLTLPSPTTVHHAGDVDVDAAGRVWFGVGDGGPSQGRSARAQDLNDLHGKILRIDPRPTPDAAYQIPPGNPFAGRADARPEIWAYGLRNPWRFELDPVTGDLWIGDVGRNAAEEIDHLPGPQTGAGANLGWPYLEGTTAGLGAAPSGLVGPVLEYSHDGRRCAVTGGAVYRGDAIPTLQGAYLYSDLCDGIVRALSVADGAILAERTFDGAQAGYPVSFGTDLAGEMYVCSFDLNTVFRIVAA